jgi:hydroxyethylthiazole kinase-like uncharacterized protein yjeF
VTDPVAALVVGQYPDVVLADRGVDARCVGPGLDADRGAQQQVLAALADPTPLVLDASALAVLADPAVRAGLDARGGRGWITVLTPHAGEFARLGFDPAGGPLTAARRAAAGSGAVVVLKGPGTVVAAPAGPAWIDPFGTSALATAGSGDVLAGLLAGLLAGAARRDVLTLEQAAHQAARAVGLHGLAGRLAASAGPTVRATDVLAQLPAARAVAAEARRPG